MTKPHSREIGGRLPRSLAIAVLVALLALAACGGDDEAATEATTAATAANVRLDPTAWNTYVTTRESARAVNERAITTFRSCRKLLGTDVPVERVQDCLSTAASDVVAEGQNVLSVLDALAADVAGACADATVNLRGNVKLYISTVNAIDLSIQHSSLPTTQDVESSTQQLIASREAADRFERACKPPQ